MKIYVLLFLKCFGFFKIFKFLNRNKLLIITYHGFETIDEASFRPKLFIKPSTLNQRMQYIRDNGFNLVDLNDSLKMVRDGNLPDNSIVITVDDGWYSTKCCADEIFAKYSAPYTVYITTYYSEKNMPIPNIALQYILWKSNGVIDLDSLDAFGLSGSFRFERDRENITTLLLEHMKTLQNNTERVNFVKKVAKICKFDYENLERTRCLGLLTLSEIEKMSNSGVDIQLHTHRHTMPYNDKNKLEDEIDTNHKILLSVVKKKLEHFCYPSGAYGSNCHETLIKKGIKSATTCNPGFVTDESDLYYLPRFLDGENINQIVFEAELCGVLEAFRKIKGLRNKFHK